MTISKSYERLTDQTLESINNTKFINGVFVNCRFTKLSNVRFIDCQFENCDFSGIDLSSVTFEECFVYRCNFQNILICGDLTVTVNWNQEKEDWETDVRAAPRIITTFRKFENCDFRGAVIFGEALTLKALMHDKTNEFAGAWLGGCLITMWDGQLDERKHMDLVFEYALCPEMSTDVMTKNDSEVFHHVLSLDDGVMCPTLATIGDLAHFTGTEEGGLRLWARLSDAMDAFVASNGQPFEGYVERAVRPWLKLQGKLRRAELDEGAHGPPLRSDPAYMEGVAQAVTSIIMQQQAMYRKMNPSSPWFRE